MMAQARVSTIWNPEVADTLIYSSVERLPVSAWGRVGHHVPRQTAYVTVYEIAELVEVLCGIIASVGIDDCCLADSLFQQLAHLRVFVADANQFVDSLRVLFLWWYYGIVFHTTRGIEEAEYCGEGQKPQCFLVHWGMLNVSPTTK